MNVLIKNATDTSSLQPPFPYSTWIEYWESRKGKLSESTLYRCPASGCNSSVYRKDLDGCHVKKVNDPSKKTYIIPLCSSCNHRTDSFYVDENLLVPAP